MNLSWRHTGLAALSGVLATVALLISPIVGTLPPIVPPYLPIDLRLVTAPILFTATYLFTSRARWPTSATSLVALALASAIGAHIHASAALSFAGVEWAQPGTRINPIAMAFSVGSVLLALVIALERASDRFAEVAQARGLPTEEIAQARKRGDRLRQEALTTAGISIVALSLVLRIVDQISGGQELPLNEVFALAVILGLGAVLIGFGKGQATT